MAIQDIIQVSQEERSIFWEVTVSLILSKKLYMYMYLILNSFWARAFSLYTSKIVDKKEISHPVSNTGIYCSSNKVGSLPSIIHFLKFHRQLLRWHGMLLISAVYNVLYSTTALSRKPFGIGHIHIHFLCLEWLILWPPTILTFPLGTFCIKTNFV
jgi:hypothetical protein